MNTRLTPSESFLEDLTALDLTEAEVLNSKVQRELTHEYVHDRGPDAETAFRSDELAEEFDRRDDTRLALVNLESAGVGEDTACQMNGN